MKWRLPIALAVIGAILLVIGGKGLITTYVLPAHYITDPDSDWTQLKNGSSVAADFYFLYPPIGYYSDDNGNDTSAIYVCPDIKYPDGDEYGYDTHFIGVMVNSADFARYDKLVNKTDYSNWTDDDYIIFDGYLRKLKTEEKEYFVDYLKNSGYSDSEIEEMLIPYVCVKSQTPIAYIGMFAGGLLSLLIGILVGVLFVVKRK